MLANSRDCNFDADPPTSHDSARKRLDRPTWLREAGAMARSGEMSGGAAMAEPRGERRAENESLRAFIARRVAAPVEQRLVRAIQAHTALFVTFCALAILTLLIVPVGPLRFSYPAGAVRAPLATAGAIVAVLSTALAYLWFSFAGSFSTLLIAIGFFVVAFNQLIFGGVLANPFSVTAQELQYYWAIGRILSAVLLLAGAWYGRQPDRTVRRPAIVFVVGCVTAVGVMAILEAPVFIGRNSLPRLIAANPSQISHATGLAPGLTPVAIAIAGIGAVMFLLAAYLLLGDPDPRRYPRGDWLAVALVIRAFSHIHYLLFPVVMRGTVSTGDLLRLAFFTVLFIGFMWEVRLLFREQRERSLELEALSHMRAEVSRVLTHDLTNSVAALRNYAVAITGRWERLDEPTRSEAAASIEHQTRRIRDLVDETVTAMNAGAVATPLSMRLHGADELVESAVEAFPRLDERVRLRIDPGVRETLVCADANGVSSIVVNLLSNAAKYSDRRSPIEVRAFRAGGDLTVSVTDHGPGIQESEQSELFQRFHRLSSAGSTPGWGVGLWTSQEIARAHGGRIAVASRPGEGSTFTLALPIWQNDREGTRMRKE
jgi:signal transduction histidine kinase